MMNLDAQVKPVNQSTTNRNKTTYGVIFLVILALMVGVSAYLGNSKAFIDFAFSFNDPVTEGVYEPVNGPLEPTQYIAEWETLPLPAAIEQPSGIAYDGQTFKVVTDLAEIFELDNERAVNHRFQMQGGWLISRQGFSEGVTFIDDTKALVVAGGNRLLTIDKSSAEWQVEQDMTLDLDPTVEVQALTYDASTQQAYLAYTLNNDIYINILTLDGKTQATYQLSDFDNIVLKDNRSIADIEITGLDYENGILYALGAPYNILFLLDLEAQTVVETIGLQGLNDSSGLAVWDDTIYVVTDHEYSEPLPPLHSARLN